jgi:uncharacterized membrane-anchored protein
MPYSTHRSSSLLAAAWARPCRRVIPLPTRALAAIFNRERVDRSKTDAWYWMAVLVILLLVEVLVEYAVTALGLGRAAVFAGLAVLLMAIFAVAWSGSAFVITSHMISRPGLAAKPMSSPPYWIAMAVASALGTAASDFFILGLGLGHLGLAMILAVLVAGVFALWRLPQANRQFVYWLTIAIVCATGTAVGDFFTAVSHRTIGLPLGAALTGALTVALFLLWRQPRLNP